MGGFVVDSGLDYADKIGLIAGDKGRMTVDNYIEIDEMGQTVDHSLMSGLNELGSWVGRKEKKAASVAEADTMTKLRRKWKGMLRNGGRDLLREDRRQTKDLQSGRSKMCQPRYTEAM